MRCAYRVASFTQAQIQASEDMLEWSSEEIILI